MAKRCWCTRARRRCRERGLAAGAAVVVNYASSGRRRPRAGIIGSDFESRWRRIRVSVWASRRHRGRRRFPGVRQCAMVDGERVRRFALIPA